ncbi:hypothetical protein [Chloracidobacterium aggregatum]|uniref:hypothetical protein n=1 Tax=Chloracidobacterium aggregatum TaxID=2851959 RepID=UPI001B8C2370|nr:hypothetical protein [Chloracidobacterium aggregatum]QUV84869.1 hypothetical protein J8C03_00840 [Chloracidobacterium sp. 2]
MADTGQLGVFDDNLFAGDALDPESSNGFVGANRLVLVGGGQDGTWVLPSGIGHHADVAVLIVRVGWGINFQSDIV